MGPDDLANISHQSNVLNFTAGASPYNIAITWLYQRQNAVYPIYGDITAAGAAEVLLNGVLVNNLPTITPALLQVLGTQNIVLPDTGINKIRFTLPTTTGYNIYTEFDAQIKPLF